MTDALKEPWRAHIETKLATNEPDLDIRDALNNEVPPYLEQAFSGRRQLLNIITEIKKQSDAVGLESLLEHGKHVDIENVQRLLALACDLITTSAPFIACDCPAGTIECPKCNGDLWLPASESRETLSLALRRQSRAS